MAPGLCALLLLALASPPVGAQEQVRELPLKRDLPPGPCESRISDGPPPELPDEADRREANRLLSEGNRSAILGDQEDALALLREAADLDPLAPAIAYRLGRVLEAAGEETEALVEFCRYLALEGDGPDATDARARAERIASADEPGLAGPARAAFESGITAFDGGQYETAARHFSRALVEAPDWYDAYYNRGVSYLRAGRARAGFADLDWYLEANPGAADRAQVQAVLGQLAPALERAYSPGVAFTAGLVIPGLGQFYSGQPGLGFLILGTAGVSAGVGFLIRDVEVDCLGVPVGGECPPDQVVDRRVDRPFLVPGLVGAGAVTVLGAILALRRARSFGGGGGMAMGAGEVRIPLSDARVGNLAPSMRVEAAPWWHGGGARLSLELRF